MSYIIYPGVGAPLRGSFGTIAQARPKAQAIANEQGIAAMITSARVPGKRPKTAWVYPKKVKNPRLPVGVPLKATINRNGTVTIAVPNKYLKKKNPLMRGTSYFVSRDAAVRYYKDYEGSRAEAVKAVARKLAGGEIHIGKPPLRAGEKSYIIRGEGRYGIEG